MPLLLLKSCETTVKGRWHQISDQAHHQCHFTASRLQNATGDDDEAVMDYPAPFMQTRRLGPPLNTAPVSPAGIVIMLSSADETKWVEVPSHCRELSLSTVFEEYQSVAVASCCKGTYETTPPPEATDH
jgi:hypothetical protein